MGLFAFFEKKQTLGNMSSDDLRRRRIAIEQEQKRIDKETTRLAEDESQLKSEYQQAGSETQKRIVARRIQGIRSKMSTIQIDCDRCYKFLTLVDKLESIKSQESLLRRIGMDDILNMDMADLQVDIDSAIREATLVTDKIDSMLEPLDDAIAELTDDNARVAEDNLMAELDAEMNLDQPSAESTDDAEFQQKMAQIKEKAQQIQREHPASENEA